MVNASYTLFNCRTQIIIAGIMKISVNMYSVVWQQYFAQKKNNWHQEKVRKYQSQNNKFWNMCMFYYAPWKFFCPLQTFHKYCKYMKYGDLNYASSGISWVSRICCKYDKNVSLSEYMCLHIHIFYRRGIPMFLLTFQENCFLLPAEILYPWD